jgi:hypothetical protein
LCPYNGVKVGRDRALVAVVHTCVNDGFLRGKAIPSP